jgi:hypothetical protein
VLEPLDCDDLFEVLEPLDRDDLLEVLEARDSLEVAEFADCSALVDSPESCCRRTRTFIFFWRFPAIASEQI